MKILIVEDTEAKSAQLRAFVSSEFENVEVVERRSYNSGLSAILQLVPDIVLLDMSMPTFDRKGAQSGGRTRYYAGRDILHELRRLNLPCRAVVVTQFDTFGDGNQKRTLAELRKELESEFPERYLGTVYYHPSRFDWKNELRKKLLDAGGCTSRGASDRP